jgi:hypothetical protein
MKVKREYAILLVVIVALGLYLFFRSTDRTSYSLPEIPKLKTQDLTKIEISKEGHTATLTRQDGKWRVSPGDYPADTRLVDRILEDLAALKVTALVSETQNYARYDLDDSHQIRVTAYQDGKVVRAFQIGKAADTMRHTHIILADDANVYHAQGNFRNDFDQSVENLRDKTVLAFKPDEVTELLIQTADNALTITKTEPPQPVKETGSPSDKSEENTPPMAPTWQISNGQTVDNESVAGLLKDLAGLKCRAYLTDHAKTDFSKPTYLIRIQSGETSTLEIFAPPDENASEVPARSSLRSDPFTLSDFDLDPIKDFLADLNGSTEDASPEANGSASP